MEIKDGKVILDIKADEMGYPKVLEEYLEVVEEKTNMMIEKVNKYGNQRYIIENWEYDSKMIYSDIQRKFNRLKNITWKFEDLEDSNEKLMEDLRETYGDTLNYCVLAIQIIDKYLKEWNW